MDNYTIQKFITKISQSKDFDLINTNNINEDFDYVEDIRIRIKWKALVVNKLNAGIIDIVPMIESVELYLIYSTSKEISKDKFKEEEKKYSLNLEQEEDFVTHPLPERQDKWLVSIEYDEYGDDLTRRLVLTGIEFDFKEKEITIKY
jgi:hypothetical protein